MSDESGARDGRRGAWIERFEDFVAWQKARALATEVYRITDVGAFAHDFGLKGQMRRAAVSVMSNIAEGFERGRPAEFHQFLSVAKGSCAEPAAWGIGDRGWRLESVVGRIARRPTGYNIWIWGRL